MSTALDFPAEPPRPILSEGISGSAVIAMLYHLSPNSPYVPQYGEISEAIARASTEDPLFPHRPDGAEWTAAILVALAFHESNCSPNLVGGCGAYFGLWQIAPPTPQLNAGLLLIPRTASYIAIDLIRKSFTAARGKGIEHGLSWFVSMGKDGKDANAMKTLQRSMARMMTAQGLMKRYYSKRGGPPPQLPPTPRNVPLLPLPSRR